MDFLANIDGVRPYIAHEDGKLIQGTLQDCTPFAEAAKERHRSGDHGSKDFKLAAQFAPVLVEVYCNTNGIDFAEFMGNPVHIQRMCNDPALKDFRVWPGAV